MRVGHGSIHGLQRGQGRTQMSKRDPYDLTDHFRGNDKKKNNNNCITKQ